MPALHELGHELGRIMMQQKRELIEARRQPDCEHPHMSELTSVYCTTCKSWLRLDGDIITWEDPAAAPMNAAATAIREAALDCGMRDKDWSLEELDGTENVVVSVHRRPVDP